MWQRCWAWHFDFPRRVSQGILWQVVKRTLPWGFKAGTLSVRLPFTASRQPWTDSERHLLVITSQLTSSRTSQWKTNGRCISIVTLKCWQVPRSLNVFNYQDIRNMHLVLQLINCDIPLKSSSLGFAWFFSSSREIIKWWLSWSVKY